MSSSSSKPQTNSISHGEEEEEEFSTAIGLITAITLPMILRAAIELELFEIIAKNTSHPETPGYLSASEIASHLPIKIPHDHKPSAALERLLRFLSSFSLLRCRLSAAREGGGGGKRWLYGLAPLVRKYFVCDENGVSLVPLLLFNQDKVVTQAWYHMKDAILEGGIPFNKAHGVDAFEYPKKDMRFNEVFNRAMQSHTAISMKQVVDKYKGFEALKQIVDVGGGFGATLGIIVSKYPHIEGINYDLPHVVKTAPPWPGVEHVGGDMFESVPKGEVIFMKWILHDWSDEKCLKLLKNCWKALPDSGKVIVVETILPENPEESDSISRIGFTVDMITLTMNPGGKERTEKEFDALAKKAGFAASKPICHIAGNWVIEFYKKI